LAEAGLDNCGNPVSLSPLAGCRAGPHYLGFPAAWCQSTCSSPNNVGLPAPVDVGGVFRSGIVFLGRGCIPDPPTANVERGCSSAGQVAAPPGRFMGDLFALVLDRPGQGR